METLWRHGKSGDLIEYQVLLYWWCTEFNRSGYVKLLYMYI